VPHVETHDCDACDGLGRLLSVNIADGRPRTVTFTNAPTGQVLARIETSAAANNPADYYYFVDGVQVGELSNNGNHDLSRATYSETFVTRNWNFNNNLTSQPFRWNTTGGVTRGQFGGSGYDPISPESNGMQGTDSRYTVREGDTLQGIAASLWGDSSLWYMIAEANGLSGAQSLAAGTSLRIPDKVTNIHNSARTFEVYDPNRALGDLSPTAAKPPKKAGNKCGVFGQIMMVVIAVAVTALTYGALGGVALTGLSAIGAGAVAGAAGSIASQAFGVATGIQDKFSWKGVAMAALAGGVSAGVGQVFKGAMLGSQFLGDAVRGAASSAITQGIGVAVGLQKKFDFAGVAAAGVGAGVFGAASRHMASKGLGVAPQDITPDTIRNAAFYANQGLSGAAGAIANAATRTLANGSDFGDNVLAALPDVIGSTIGNMIADPITGRLAEARQEARVRKLSSSTVLPKDMRGTEAVSELVREAVENGASNKRIRQMLADAGAQEYMASRQTDIDMLAAGTAGSLTHPNILTADFHLASQDPFGNSWRREQTRRYTLEGIFDALTRPLGDAQREIDRLKRQGVQLGVRGTAYVLTTAAINNPFTSDLAAQLLTEWRDGTSQGPHFFGWNSAGSRELFVGYSGDYYRNITQLGISQLTSRGGGAVVDGMRIRVTRIPDFTEADGAYGMRDGINVGDVIGTFTYGVSAQVRSGFIYFRGENAMSLGSFAAENRLQHGQVSNPTRGRFSTTRQTFEWRVPVPSNLRRGR
jgi:hypothetical protein